MNLPKTNDVLNGIIGNLVFMQSFLDVLSINIKHDRVSNSLLELFYVLLSGGAFDESANEFFVQTDMLFLLIKKEVLKSKDVKKLSSAIQM